MNRTFIIIAATSKFGFFACAALGAIRHAGFGVGAVAGFCYKCKLKVLMLNVFLAKSIPWREYFFQVSFCKLKLKADLLQKPLPGGSGFQMKIQIQTSLMNAIWGPKSENLARVPVAHSPGGPPLPSPEAKLARGCLAITQYLGDWPSIVGAPWVLWIPLQLAEPWEARPQPLAQPPAGAWSITSRPQQ